MTSLPFTPAHIGVPPIKCQGIKTKLVPFISNHVQWRETASATWIEPFLGSGVVAFNLLPERAILADTNQHIIAFYQGIQRRSLTGDTVREFLTREGERLQRLGPDYYYTVRQRFNQTHTPLDFLFLNRACFNGLMRFNRHGQFNVPFCRKPQRFSRSYITKIANQVEWVAQKMKGKKWEFRVAPWKDILLEAQAADFVYLDPPYIGRHADYFNRWDQWESRHLAEVTQQLCCGFAVSMWLENQHRQNDHIQQCWQGVDMKTCQHFYHVGSREDWRGAIAEALLIKPGYSV